MFVVANTTALMALLLAGVAINSVYGGRPGFWPTPSEILTLCFVGWGYLVGYLGLGLLAIRALRRVALVTMPAAVLIQLLLIFAGSGIPTSIQLMSVTLRNRDYSYLQITNPFWTLVHLGNPNSIEAVPILLMVSTGAICILLLNLPGVLREISQVRIAAPTRVVEDDLELNPPPAELPKSPWEAEDTVA
jgi:hypothetical protein